MGSRGREFVRANYSRDAIVKRLIEIYAEVIQGAG
jgi:hypothetical protein